MNKIFIIISIIIPSFLNAQNQDGAKFQAEYQLQMKKANGSIKIDRVHDEADWANANIAKDFWQKFPTNDRRSICQTEVKATFDDKYLYFAAICHDTSSYIIQTLKRDVSYWGLYYSQRNNLNINSRLQFRYSPMSDSFLVYTDNYLVDPNLKNRNRALVFKLNYWLPV